MGHRIGLHLAGLSGLGHYPCIIMYSQAELVVMLTHQSVSTKKLMPVDQLAMLHGITLPHPSELPASYSMRKWVTRRIATLAGWHKQVWQQIKDNPTRLQAHRQGSALRMRRLRAARKMATYRETRGSAGSKQTRSKGIKAQVTITDSPLAPQV